MSDRRNRSLTAAVSWVLFGTVAAVYPFLAPQFWVVNIGAYAMVLGTITNKQAPVLRQIYAQMTEPKWVLSVGVCASSGGMYRTYATMQGIDRIIPVDFQI